MKKITPKLEKEIEKRLRRGELSVDICDTLGVSESPVRRIKRRIKNELPIKPEKEQAIKDMLNEGATVEEIRAALHVSDHRVTAARKKMGDALPVESRSIPRSPTEKMRMLAEKAEIGKIFHRKTFFEMIGENIIKEVRALPAPVRLKPERLNAARKQEPEEMIMQISDSQIGSLVDVRESGGLGAYSAEIFRQRLDYLKSSLEKIYEIHLHNTPYPVFNFFFLGDIVEGSTIFKGQQRQTDIYATRQVIEAVDKLGEFVAWVAGLYPWQVNCYCVVGNHGRVGDKGEQSPLNNFDYLVYHFMAEKLKNYKNVAFNIPDSWYMLVKRMGKIHLLLHGEDIKGWMNIPFYGLERSDARYKEMLHDFGISYDYYHCGHHHQAIQIKGRRFMNSTFVGGSELSLKNMVVNSIPTQTLMSIHPKYGVTWTREIQLCDPDSRLGKVKVW